MQTGLSDAPWIRLAGRWLEKAGFPISSRVRVEVEEGKLIQPINLPRPLSMPIRSGCCRSKTIKSKISGTGTPRDNYPFESTRVPYY
ncbi:SymE family type I addiction module toxin [Paraburkholderia rhizosphaerae]|uniref:SymE family type I addiction module toxin n=1 Tax=Paraburkholderia rhizosphaerae TaxID=480658 RepID=UPI002444249B|nr:SymE family type I addiction module toxin [Paraburkholderia rhizosphaerae]